MHHNRLGPFIRDTTALVENHETNGFLESLQPAMETASHAVADTIRKRPLAGIVAGLAIGVVLGCLVKRR